MLPADDDLVAALLSFQEPCPDVVPEQPVQLHGEGDAEDRATGEPARGRMSPAEARRELGLSAEEFETAVQSGELWTFQVPGEPGTTPRIEVSRASLRRLVAEDYPVGLKERLRLVGAVTGAELLGITRDRFVRMAKAGCFRPARWYLNRYRAVVWLYPVYEVLAYALDNPEWLTGRLPRTVREGLADGLDKRAAGWRTRRTGLLARHAPDEWHEAAAWFALLGEEEAADLLPDEAVAGRLRAAVPPPPSAARDGRRRKQAETLPVPLIADDAIEVAHARLRMTIAIERAEKPKPAPPPPLEGAAKSSSGSAQEREAPAAPLLSSPTTPGRTSAATPTRSEPETSICSDHVSYSSELSARPSERTTQPFTAVSTSCSDARVGRAGLRTRRLGRSRAHGSMGQGPSPDGPGRRADDARQAGEPVALQRRRIAGVLRRMRRPRLWRGRE